MEAQTKTIPSIDKDPSATLGYGFDLSAVSNNRPNGQPYLAPGETVTGLTVTSDAGVTVVSSGIYGNAQGVAAVLVASISGGTLGKQYQVHFCFTTSLGNVDTRTLSLNLVQK